MVCASNKVFFLHGFNSPKCCCTCDWVSTVSSAKARNVNRIHDFGTTSYASKRQSACNSLCCDNHVWHNIFMFYCKHVSGTCKTGLNFIGNEDNAVIGRILWKCWQESLRWDDEATFTLNRFDNDCSNVVRTDFFIDLVSDHINRIFSDCCLIANPVEWVRHWYAINFWCKRSEAFFVWHVLCSHTHG